MRVYLRTKFEVSSIGPTSFRRDNFTPAPHRKANPSKTQPNYG